MSKRIPQSHVHHPIIPSISLSPGSPYLPRCRDLDCVASAYAGAGDGLERMGRGLRS